MDKVFSCPVCGVQNFVSNERFAVLDQASLHCWRCESEISKALIQGKEEDGARGEKRENGTMDEKILVMITVGSEEEAVKIGRALLDERLIACANIVPKIRSLYRWKGKLCDDQEVLMIVKTVHAHFPKIQEMVKRLHSYDLPEIIAFGIEDGNEAYLKWIEGETAH